jgi:nicotinamide-nucleotide amidase
LAAGVAAGHALRAAIVASGSELVRGDRQDRDGPYLAASLLELGFAPARITIVGDDPAELEPVLREGLTHDLLVVSGGLGPTHDDRTVELLARAAGVGLHVEEPLRETIEERSRAIAARLNRPYADFVEGIVKQATLPDGALWVGIVGTAPAVVLETGSSVAVALPGPPNELRQLWPRVLETEPLRRLTADLRPPARRALRFFGVSESAIARSLDSAGGEGDGVAVTICARDFELHVDLFVHDGADARADAIEQQLLADAGRFLFSREETATAELVLGLLRERGLTLATAESCTGGLVGARLTQIPGSSDVYVGGAVAYSNDVKERTLGVPAATIASYGAVSAETASAMALGAAAAFQADIAVAVTGVAGPGGGTDEKPVGLVHVAAVGPMGERQARLDFPGDRDTIRARAVASALHLVRRLVTES